MLSIQHSNVAGFFSNCTVRLESIINYFNNNKSLPEYIDSTKQFDFYKPDNLSQVDITHYFFDVDSNIDIEYNHDILFNNSFQFHPHHDIDYQTIIPFVQKYFQPSPEIRKIIYKLEQKYKINYENTCALFYRGNDKSTETLLSSYSEIFNRSQKLLELNTNLSFFIQSDETQFIKEMIKIKNSFYMKDEIRHIIKSNTTVDKITCRNDNFQFSKYFLAIVIIMSKCKYFITGSSGNCPFWVFLYRNNPTNIWQFDHTGNCIDNI